MEFWDRHACITPLEGGSTRSVSDTISTESSEVFSASDMKRRSPLSASRATPTEVAGVPLQTILQMTSAADFIKMSFGCSGSMLSKTMKIASRT